MFKVVGNNLTTIFNRVQDITTGVNLSTDSVNRYVDVFNKLNAKQAFGHGWEQFLNGMNLQNGNMASYFEDLAKQGASARASIEGVYSAILNGNTRGFGNIKSIISLYNEIGKVNPQNQAAFASAVSQTNVQLGTYLMSIRNGTASMKGYAQQLVSTTAKTLTLRVASVALNTVLMSAIPVAIGYIINKHKEEQQAIKDTGEEAEAQTNKIQSLYQSYADMKIAVDNGTESKENLTSATNDLLKALGYEGSAVDELIEKYGNLESAIDNVVISKLQEAHGDLVNSVNVYKDELLKIGDDWSASKWGNANTFSFLGDNKEYQKIKDVLNQAEGLTSSVSYGHNGRSNRYSYSLSGDNSTIEGIKQNYETLLALQEDFINEFGAEEAGELDIYKEINSRLNEIKTAYENYTSEVEALNQNASKTQVLQSLIGKELPQTIDEYKAYRQELIKSAQSSGAFIGSQEDIANSIDNTLSQMSEFEKLQNRLNNLETAKSLFVEGRFNSKPINDYIESLSDEELEILVGLDTDIFDQGIDYVQKTIDEMNGISIHGSFDISDYQEQIESVSGNIKTLQDTLDKLDNNEFDFTNDIYDLANAFPEYSTEILNASGDTEKLREVLHGILDIQPNDLINSLTKLKGSLTSDEDIRAVDNLIRILKNSTSSIEALDALVQSFDDLSSAVSTFTKNQATLTEALEEQEKHGQLSADTIQSLTEAGYAQALSVNAETGAVTLNKKALEELNQQKQIEIELDLDKKEADLITAYEEEKTKISELNKELAHTNSLRAQEIINELTALEVTHKLTAEQLAQVRALKKSLTAPNYGSSGGSSDDDEPESVKTFEAELAKRQHEINLGLRKEDASYYDWLEKAAKDAYSGIEGYEEDLWKYEEQVYEWRKDHEQDLFDQRIENLDKEKEKALENNDFSTAKTSVNTQITETQNRINKLKTSGRQDVDDEIKQLEEDLDDLGDTLNEINSQEYEFNISVIKDNVDEQIETLDRSIENTGDTKLYSEKIKVYKDGQQQILDMIEFYRKQGYAEDSAIIKELKKQWNDYQDSISDALQEQANAQVEAYNELLDEQKELLEQQKEAQDEYYDSEIKALEDKKEALEKVNETIEEQNELEEKRQAIAEAERNLYKNVRLVYSGGQWVQKAREEDLQAVEDAENDLSDTLRKQEIEALENQITALNDAKSEFDEAIDKQITAIEESEKAFEKAMENSYKVRQQLDYDFISAIVGDDKAKEYQTNVDNALKAIAESEKTDSADNSALIDSNNAVAETNREVAESNLQKLSADDALKSIYNSFQKSGALFKGTTFEKFAGNIQNSVLNATLGTTPKIADDVVKDSMVNNYTVNNNHPVINTTVNIEGRNKSDEEIANIVATTAESKVTQALTAFVQGATNRYTKMMYGNT